MLKEVTSFNIAAACVTELSWCDYCAEVEIRRTEGERENNGPMRPNGDAYAQTRLFRRLLCGVIRT